MWLRRSTMVTMVVMMATVMTGYISKHTIQTTSTSTSTSTRNNLIIIDNGASTTRSWSGKGATRVKHRWLLLLLLRRRRRSREHANWSLAFKEAIGWRGREVEGIEWRGSSCIGIVIEERAIVWIS
jgi:hypothetical protein